MSASETTWSRVYRDRVAKFAGQMGVRVEDLLEAVGRCAGPLVWFDAAEGSAVLECASCGWIVTTGNFMDERHSDGCDILRSPL